MPADQPPPPRFVDDRAGSMPSLTEAISSSEHLRRACFLALPPAVDLDLANDLVGREHAVGILDGLAAHGFGAWRSSTLDAPQFVVHEATRREARRLLRRRWAPLLRAASSRLARRYLNDSRLELALSFALDGDDPAVTERIAIRLLPLSTEFGLEVFHRVSELPERSVHGSAVLFVWMAAVLDQSYVRRAPEAIAHLEAAAVAARAQVPGQGETERVVLLGVESYALRRLGRGPAATRAATEMAAMASTVLGARRFDEAYDLAFATFGFHAGITLIHGRRYDLAARLLTDLELFTRTRDIRHRRNSILAGLSYLDAVTGRTRRSEKHESRLIDTDWPTAHVAGDIREWFKLARLMRAVGRADAEGLREGLDALADGLNRIESWSIPLLGRVLLLLLEGDAALARTFFDDFVREHLTQWTHPMILRTVHMTQRFLQLAGEEPGVAKSPPPDDALALALGAARDLDRQRAEAASEKLSKAAVLADTPFEQHIVFTVLARLGVQTDDASTVGDSSARLTALAEAHGLRIGFVLLAPPEREAVLGAMRKPDQLAAAFAAVPPIRRDAAPFRRTALSQRELDVLVALARLGSRADVARELFLSPATVKTHLRSIYRKLGAHNQSDALAKAAAAGLLTVRGRRPSR